MNAELANLASGAPPETAATVDTSNPWLGLASFTEETRAFFYGRDGEVAELGRRVQRKLLTVLFGQSGLGKTSILRAGLVPRLRGQDYCPVYVRIDYGRESPEPAEQIKQAIRQSAIQAGQWSQVGVAVEGESLWEFLHHRDDVLRDAAGTNQIPLLIFDQFEEIFTLAQSDEFGRSRAARFIEDLADLVENRPPKALEAKLDADDSAAERFDFARSDYRVLISLREDYLAPLEGLKASMPSVSQNRLRLAPMTGTQALAAVMQPGGKLVSEEVAAAIVRFVAGGAELTNAEVEPSLLSLICRELNDARIGAGRSEISLDLLAGSHASILSNFYERSLADQPAAVRRIVEDDLLTSSGFRENVAEERLLSRFTAAGATPGTLALLVNRRLLRIEERLDVRRVELTHDVLCGVVKASRDQRQEREAREATERLLAEQRNRELTARKSLLRARQVALGCTVLAIAAVVAAVFAYLSLQRARHAEREAQETRAGSEQARGQAERLLGYLSDDFVQELESFGRLNVLKEFTQRQIDYYHGLPPGLRGPETIRTGALAMVHSARTLRLLGDAGTAIGNANEAVQLLEQRVTDGDHSEPTIIALGEAYTVRAQILDNQSDPAGPVAGNRAAALLKPLADAPGASVAARRAYVEALVRVGFEQQNANRSQDTIHTMDLARKISADMGALDLSNPDMAALYAEAGAWRTGSLATLGRNEEATREAQGDVEVAEKVLALRPGNRLTLHAEQIIVSNIAAAEINTLDPIGAERDTRRMEKVSQTLLGMDPNNVTSLNNMGVAHQTLGDSLWLSGHLQESMPYYAKSLEDYRRSTTGGSGFFVVLGADLVSTTGHQAQMGEFAAARAALAASTPSFDVLLRAKTPDPFAPTVVGAMRQMPLARIAELQGDPATARRIALQAADQMRSLKLNSDLEISQTSITLAYADDIAARTAYALGDYPAAEKSARLAVAERKIWGTAATPDQRELGEMSGWLAMSIARQGRTAEAVAIIEPVVKYLRGLATHNHGDQWISFELASALYAESLADAAHAPALKQEATALLNGLSPQIRPLVEVRRLRERIQH